jgi:hypothetical protein
VELGLNLPRPGTDLAACQSEDPRVSTTNWKLLRAGASYAGALAGGWSWSARAQAQYSPDVLISGEQFGIGGATVCVERVSGHWRPTVAVFSTVELGAAELLQGLRGDGFCRWWLVARRRRWRQPQQARQRPADQCRSWLALRIRSLCTQYRLGTCGQWERVTVRVGFWHPAGG